MPTILRAGGEALPTAAKTVVKTKIALGGVDLAARKIPLVHQVRINIYPNILDLSPNLFTAALMSVEDNIDLDAHDTAVIASSSRFLNSTGFNSCGETFTFPAPLAVSTANFYFGAYSEALTGAYGTCVVYYEVKTVSAGLLIGLMQN
jgi:hypothetical protein